MNEAADHVSAASVAKLKLVKDSYGLLPVANLIDEALPSTR